VKTTINNANGVLVESDGDGFFVGSKPFERAAFNERWDDLYSEIHELPSGPTTLTYETYRDTGFPMKFFRDNQNDKIFMLYQMSHGWNHASVRPHMHWIAMGSGSGNVIFEYQYSWAAAMEGIVPAASGWVSGSVTASLTPDDQYRAQVVDFGEVPGLPESSGSSALLFFAVSRPASSNPGDTYDVNKDHGTAAANVGILFFDLHYQRDSAGTVSEY
jgi:hypothetical protein